MSDIEVEVKGLFATPVAAVMLPGAEERNAELTEIILRRHAAPSSTAASSIGGWHSTRDIVEWGGKGVERVLSVGQSIETQMAADRNGNPIKPDWKIEAWANVLGPGGSNACHYRPGSFWSGTYYVAGGGCADDTSLGGGFEMFDPRGPSPMMHAPLLKFAGEADRFRWKCGDDSPACRAVVSVSAVPAARGAPLHGQCLAHIDRFQSGPVSELMKLGNSGKRVASCG